MSPESVAPPTERRFLSETLMVELGQNLVAKGVINRRQLDDLNARRALTGETLDRLLVREGHVGEATVLGMLSELTRLPARSMAELTIQPEAVQRVPARVALRYRIMPIEIRQGVITLATAQVPSAASVDSLRLVLNLGIDWILCPESEIDKSIKHFYGLGVDAIDQLGTREVDEDTRVDGMDLAADTTDEGIIRFVNQVIAEAIRMGATDVHIEPFENRLRLRYRIDGVLQEIPLPKGVEVWRKAIASCVKIMANLNIAEKRKPHDGRIEVRYGEEEFDLRVSILPTPYGETVNLRILNRRSMFIDLEHLGLRESQMPTLEYLSSLSHGVVLLTGPTGSGKTTTLYALLSRINTLGVKIITVEDPIEYQIPGITQIQVHAQIGLTFANVLRSILRHNPDIILVGEIRDTETADIAVRSALTGHLVFSTLHTNDAPSAITRLADMGVEPYLISSCLEGVIAQRLVRRICIRCKEEISIPDAVLEEIRAAYPERSRGAKFYRGRGCPECNFTGYRGRMALFEIMVLDDTIRSLIVHERPSNEIKRAAMENGMITLRKEGWGRVLDGITTVEEVMRVARKTDAAAVQAGH